MSIINNTRERRRFIRFAIVGTIGFGVDFVSFNVFRSGLNLSPVISSVFSFFVAVTSNFILNRYWTFPDSRSKSVLGQMGQYAIVNVVGLGIRTFIFRAINEQLVDFFGEGPFTLPLNPNFWGENFALAIVVVIVMFWNFFINRYWTYNDVE